MVSTRREGGGLDRRERTRLYNQAKDAAEAAGEPSATPARLMRYLSHALGRGERPTPQFSEAERGDSDDEQPHRLEIETVDTPMDTPMDTPFAPPRDDMRATRESIDFDPTIRLRFKDELEEYLPASSNMDKADVLRSLLRETGTRDDLTDDLGQPLSMDKLLQIAQAAPIWPLLTDEQKRMFLQNEGTLPSGKQYISKRMETTRAPVRKTLVQLANGQRIQV